MSLPPESAGQEPEFHLLPMPEMRNFFTLALNFGGWIFWDNCN